MTPGLVRASANVFRLVGVPSIVQAHSCAMRSGFVRQDDGSFAASIIVAGGTRKTLRWASERHILAWVNSEVVKFFGGGQDGE